MWFLRSASTFSSALHRQQLQAQIKLPGDNLANVDIDADQLVVVDKGERPEILIDRDLDPAFLLNLLQALADGIFGIGVDRLSGVGGLGEGRVVDAERGKTGQGPRDGYPSATVSSQDRMDQMASSLKISPKAGI